MSYPSRSSSLRHALRFALGAVGAAALLAAAPARAQEPVQPIAPAKVTNPAKVELGKKLWFDPRLSRSGFISCNSCHNLSMGGSDNLKTSIGDKWQKGPINSPTVLNSSLNLAQFWDGRAKDLKEQAGGPIANPGEMAFSHDLAVDMLRSIPQYVGEFKRVFGHDKLGIDEVTAAIAAFEETLVTPNAPFDNGSRATRRPSRRRSCVATSCSRARAAWPATTAPTWAAPRSRRWAWSSPTRRTTRPRAAPP